ncbi:MAG: TIM barrel protein, partial [Herbinix sp.]|nr:TIM barrel protein [Herbinix sp.]
MNTVKRDHFATMNIQYKYYPLTRFLDDTVRYGYKNIELWGAAPHFYPDDMSYRQIKQVRHEIESRGLNIICYTPEQCVYPINLASEHVEERKRSLRFFEDSIRAAAELGTDQVLVTSGTGYYDGSNYENAWKYAVENISELGRMAQDYNVRLALEVLRHDESNLVYNLETLKRMVQEINMDSVGANVDTIPMALAGECPKQYIDELGEKLIHVHFIDGAPKGHL